MGNTECTECVQPSSNLEKFFETWKEDYSDKAFCPLCGLKSRIEKSPTAPQEPLEVRSSSEQSAFQEHLESHIGGDIFVCEMCKVSSSKVDVMAKHVEVHNKSSKKENEETKKEDEVVYVRYAIT